MSLLWRISISKEAFNTVAVPQEIQDELRSSLDSGISLGIDQYCCFVHQMYNADGKPFGGTILGPFETQYKGNQVLNILIDSYIYMDF